MAGAEVDGCSWCVGVGVVAVAELTVSVVSPTCDASVVEDGARVIRAGGDCGGGASGADVDGCAWCVGVGGCSVSELTIRISSPACDASVVEYCAGMKTTISRNAYCGASGADVDGCAWCGGVGVVAVAKLTSIVTSPACDIAVVEYCAGMPITACDRNWC